MDVPHVKLIIIVSTAIDTLAQLVQYPMLEPVFVLAHRINTTQAQDVLIVEPINSGTVSHAPIVLLANSPEPDQVPVPLVQSTNIGVGLHVPIVLQTPIPLD